MKELTGSASATTVATPAQAMALLEAIEGYPSWAPDVVKEAEVLERDAGGHPTKARTKLHVERGPLTRDFNLLFDVKVDTAGRIALSRVPHEPSDGERLNVPRFMPLGDVGDATAQQLVSAATRALQS